jgi:hypothetical protein
MALQMIDLEAEIQLGPVVLRCRNRRRKDAWLALGGSPVSIYLTPLPAAFFLTFPLVGLAMYQKVPPPLLTHPVWGPVLGIWFVACSASIYWYYFTAPRADWLVLHQNGFRYRRRLVRFADLSSIRMGRINPRIVELCISFNRLVGRINPESRASAQLADASREASVTLQFQDGSSWSLPNVLVNHEASDLERFFEAIATRHPELFPPQEAGTGG